MADKIYNCEKTTDFSFADIFSLR